METDWLHCYLTQLKLQHWIRMTVSYSDQCWFQVMCCLSSWTAPGLVDRFGMGWAEVQQRTTTIFSFLPSTNIYIYLFCRGFCIRFPLGKKVGLILSLLPIACIVARVGPVLSLLSHVILGIWWKTNCFHPEALSSNLHKIFRLCLASPFSVFFFFLHLLCVTVL